MSESRQRYSELYFGQTTTTFTILGEFEMQPNRLKFNFETFSSVESFESGAKPIERLRKEFLIEGASFDSFKNSNAEVFASMTEKILIIALVGGRGYKLNRFYISTIAKFLTAATVSPNNNDRPTANKYGDDYDQIIAENLPLIAQVINLTWSYGKANDEFLNTLIVNDNSLIEKFTK